MKATCILTLTFLLAIPGFAAGQEDEVAPPAPESVLDAPADTGETVIHSEPMGTSAPTYGYGYGYGYAGGYGMGYGGDCCGNAAYWATPYHGRWGHSFRYRSFPRCAMWDVSQSYCRYRTRSPYGPGCGRWACRAGACCSGGYASDCCTSDYGKGGMSKDKVMVEDAASGPAMDSVVPPAPDAVPEPPAPEEDASA